MRIASYGHSLGGAVGLSMLEGVGEPRPSVRCADAGVLLRGVPTADSPRGDSPMASRGRLCVPIITQPSCTSTRRDAPCWCPRRFATPRRIGHFRSAAPYRSLSVAASAADRAGARRCAARFASCAFGEDENQTQVRSFRSHHAPRPCISRPRDHPCMHARADDCGLLDVDSSGRLAVS